MNRCEATQRQREDVLRAPVSDGQAQLLQEPQVTLYIARSDEDLKAFNILESAGVGFQVLQAESNHATHAEFGGLVFIGAENIQNLAEAFTQIENILRDEVVRASINDNPDLANWMSVVFHKQMIKARQDLDQIVSD